MTKKQEVVQISPEVLARAEAKLREAGYPEDEIARTLTELAKRPIIKETQEACTHPLFQCLKDTVYQCVSCNMVMRVVAAEAWSVDGYCAEQLDILRSVTGGEQWRQKYLKK
jgi:predicted metal-binding transcription factor (methanogenesis marker protein 9)